VIFLAMVSFPLGRTLVRLREETQLRRTVFNALYQVIPRSAIFRENLDVLPASLRLQIMAVLPHGLPSERRIQLEEEIHARTGRDIKINIYNVATRDEMIELTRQLGPKIESAVSLPSIDQESSQLWAYVQTAIESAWPSNIAPLLKYRIAFENGSSKMLVYLAYLADQDLGILGEEAIRKILQERTGSRQLELELERISQTTPILFRSRSDAPTSDGQESLNRIAAQIRRFPNISCAIGVPGTGQKAMIARHRRRAEQIQKLLIEETRIPMERISIKSTSEASNAITLQLLVGARP
jgi:hypothetical protein